MKPGVKVAEQVKVGDTVEIDGIIYLVEMVDRQESRPHLRQEMDKHSVNQDLVLRRPKGKRLYCTVQWNSGRIDSRLVSVASL